MVRKDKTHFHKKDPIMHKTLLLVLFSMIVFGCSNKHDNSGFNSINTDKNTSMDQVKTMDRKLIKNGSIRFETYESEKTNLFIKSSLSLFDAYISDEKSYNTNTKTGYDLTIRVPAIKYDSLMGYLLEKTKMKELNTTSTQLNDVTEDFIDTQARLKIKKESEQKLIELLKQTRNLTEVLEIQKQLTDLRADIESTEAHLNYVSNQVDFSTINVSFYEKNSYSKRFLGDFWGAIKDGWQVFLHVVTLLAYLWVVLIVVLLGRWGYRYYKKK